MKYTVPRTNRGFTLVELLIVIVVIAILAAITIVAYNGIQDRARSTVLQHDISEAVQVLGGYNATNGSYPADQATANTVLKPSSGTSFAYVPAGNAGYCITASNATTSYSATTANTTPTQGTCATNLIFNPNFENGATGTTAYWNTNSGVTVSASNLQAHDGNRSLLVTRTGTADDYTSYTNVTVTPGTAYTLSLWVYLTGTGATGNSRHVWVYNGASGMTVVDQPYPATINSWQRMTYTFMPTASTLEIRIYPMTGAPMYVDSIMLTASSNAFTNYADPAANPSTWMWTGSVDGSTSVGPLQ